jgi:hypothetical protein
MGLSLPYVEAIQIHRHPGWGKLESETVNYGCESHGLDPEWLHWGGPAAVVT